MARHKSTLRFLIANPVSILIVIFLIVCVVYWPGLNGPYVLDDGENILLNSAVALVDLTSDNIRNALMSNDSGPLKRPIAAVSFALNHYFNAGFYPVFVFKATNLVIHLLNTCLIYLLCMRMLGTPRLATLLDNKRRQQVAIFTSGLWALHPIQLTNILYVVQRMNSLSALFVLVGLILFVRGRSLLDTTKSKWIFLMVGGALGGMGFGSAAKENAALLPLFALTIEYALFGFKAKNKQKQRYLRLFYVLLVALPVISLATYLVINSELIVGSYATRHFSLFERVLTETRILWHYTGLILFPISQNFSLFHDDIALSTSLFTPITTLFAIIGLLITLGAGLIQAKCRPVISFAILWFLSGHVLESGVLGLELAHEHRNYLPSYGIFFAVAFGLIFLIKDKHPAFFLVPATFLLTFSVVTWARANIWGDIHSLAEHTVRTHPDSPRANDFAARTSLAVKHDAAAAMRYTLAGLRLAPEEVGFCIDMQILLSNVAAEIENTLQQQRKRNIYHRFDVRITGLNENIQAIETKNGLLLSHGDSNPETILTLLETKPITVHGIFSLENLRHCILDSPRPCAQLRSNALTWFSIAAENSRTSRDYRAILASNTAMLHADAGDDLRALEYIDRAVALLPERISYQLTRAEYLTRLGRLDEAEHAIGLIVDGLASTDTLESTHDPDLRKLRALHDKVAREKRANPSRLK